MIGTTIVRARSVAKDRRQRRAPRKYAEQSDRQLVAGASDRDALALAELFDRHGALAYGVAMGVTRNPMCAQDAVQDAFVQLWLKASTIDTTRTSVAAWITMLARRRAIDITRREANASRPRLASRAELETPPAEEQALIRIESQRARDALEALNPAQRTVIELAYYRGLSQAEIAESLEIPLGTVKSRTFSALACLRTRFASSEQACAHLQPRTGIGGQPVRPIYGSVPESDAPCAG